MAIKQDKNDRSRGLECRGDLACSKSLPVLFAYTAFDSPVRYSTQSLNGLGDQKQAYSVAELPILKDSICL